MSGLSRYGTVGDVHGFYAQLGITLVPRATREAPLRCFADPEAHRRADRAPSCSVNVTSGTFLCHGCGARGGAYDAALLHGRTPRQAIDLMVAFGLTQRRDEPRRSLERRPASEPAAAAMRPGGLLPTATRPEVSDRQLIRWANRLADDHGLLSRLEAYNAWNPSTLVACDVGWDGRRVVIPARDLTGKIVSVMRYAPRWRRRPGTPKMVAVHGSQKALFPSLSATPGGGVWIAEGQPDALAARSAGLPAIGIPGVWGWDSSWAPRFANRDVVVCMDADEQGRAAARRIAASLIARARSVRVLDLDPGRDSSLDLTDVVRATGLPSAAAHLRELAAAEPQLTPEDLA